jgi:hypothetical protein
MDMLKPLHAWFVHAITTTMVVLPLTTSTASAQVVGPPNQMPTALRITAESAVGQMKALADQSAAHQQSVHDATMAVLEPLTAVSETQFYAHNNQISQDAFGEPYVAGQSGMGSIGPGGPLNVSTFVQVQSTQGAVAVIHSLSLWQLNSSLLGALPPLPAGVASYEAYTYAGVFGGADPHVGIAVRLVGQSVSVLILVPLTIVQQNGAVGDDQVASFLAEFFNTGFDGPGGYLAWLYANVPSVIPPSMPAMAPFEAGGPCDTEALANCISGALGELQSDLAEATQDYDDAVNEIMEDWADDAGDGLLGDIATGALGGALGGAVGGLPGALAGAGIGAIVGGVSWLASTGEAAEDAQEDIAEAGADYHAEACAALQSAATAIQGCFNAHCPAASDYVSDLLADALAESGC